MSNLLIHHGQHQTDIPLQDLQKAGNRHRQHLFPASMLTRLWKREPRMGFSPQLSHATPWCTCLVLESPPEKAVFLAAPLLWGLLLPPVFCTFLMAIPAGTTDKKMSPYVALPQVCEL